MAFRLLEARDRAEFLFPNLFRARNVLFVPLFHPFSEVAEESTKFHPLLGEGVFHSGRSLGVDFSLDDLSLVKLIQPLSEACGSYPLYSSLELVESCRLLET